MQDLENYLLKVWYSDNSPPLYLRLLSSVFNLVRQLRLKFFKLGLLKSEKLTVPIIVVGNITVGGSGKTPVVLFLIEKLRAQGLNPAVISRGYGGNKSSSVPILLDASSTAKEVGDEARMLYLKTQVPFAVGKNRVAAAKALLNKYSNVDLIISDDGLQHYKLQRDLEIVVVDGERGFGNQYLLPAGALREPMSRLDRVNLLLSNGQPEHSSISNLTSKSFDLVPEEFIQLNKNVRAVVEDFRGKTVHAFAGIGNPQRFFKLLNSLGMNVVEHVLGDHAIMSEEFFSQHKGATIVMTEKDAVKYPDIDSDNAWYLPVSLHMPLATEEHLMALIIKTLPKTLNVQEYANEL